MNQQSAFKCYYMGKAYPLNTLVDPSIKKAHIEFDGIAFVCKTPHDGDDLSKTLKSFYVKACRKLIRKRLDYYQPQFKIKFRSFSIENSHSQWGSCNSERHLTFQWKLIIFPLKVIDYVVVHELCHLKHMNHDRSFWRLVGKVYPNYREAMAILGTEKTKRL